MSPSSPSGTPPETPSETASKRPSGRGRSSFGPTVVLGLGGAALATVGAGRPWAEAETTAQGTRTVQAAGTDVAAAALPLALVALAAWGAVLVLRSRGRRVVAVLGLLAAAGAAVVAATGAGDSGDVAGRLLGGASDVAVTTTVWPAITVAGAVAAALAFAVALVHAPRWPEMSSRYDSPVDRGQEREAMTDAELWRALDDGRDPTA